MGSPSIATRVALVYIANFLSYGVFVPFVPVWLRARGIEPALLGVVLALPLLMRLVSVVPVTHFADRVGRLRDVMVGCALASAVLFVLFEHVEPLLLIVSCFALAFFFLNPVLPLIDGYALTASAAHKFDFARVRLWGSLAFVVANIAAGAAIDVIGAASVPALCALTMVIVALAGLLLPAQPGHRQTRSPPGGWREALAIPGLVPLLVCAGLIQGSHGLYYNFAANHWAQSGLSGVVIGIIWSLGVVAEIALMLVAKTWIARAGAWRFLLAGAVCGILRWAVMALDPPVGGVLLAQTLHAGTFAATMLGTMALVDRLVPRHLAGTAQGMAVMLASTVTMAVTLLSGYLWEQIGVMAFAAMALQCALAALMVPVLIRRWPQLG